LNVLSLFDGISAGQVALERTGIKVDNYFASEIDKYAIKITQKNYPNTIQLGDINNWKEWNLPKIDLVMGGSPCQGFSNAGAGLNFEDPRSKLFFVFVDILKYHNPKYFLLENVKMKKEWSDIISDHMKVSHIEMNSALVSAQSRKRFYWTNIEGIVQPKDKNIFLKDIIESGTVDREKSYCIDACYYKGGSINQYLEKSRLQLVNLSHIPFHQSEKRLMVEDNSTWRKLTPLECERLQTFPNGYTEGISNTQRYKGLGNSWTVDMVAHIFGFIKQ
jgi:site-specific DNA-cytosine methylase